MNLYFTILLLIHTPLACCAPFILYYGHELSNEIKLKQYNTKRLRAAYINGIAGFFCYASNIAYSRVCFYYVTFEKKNEL